MTATRTCRRCGRPLYAALAVAAGVGGRCALLDLADAGTGPLAAVTVPHARAAVALVASFLDEGDVALHGPVLDGADPVAVAEIMAAVAARMLARTEGGQDWLRDMGLAAAEQGAGTT